MPAWIHERAMNLAKGMRATYAPEKAKQVAFAVATQQAHALDKSPKTFVSKETGHKERFGTPKGRQEAKAKFDKPKKEYKKMAANKIAESRWAKLLRTGRLGEKEISKLMERGVFDINRHGTGMFKGVERIQNAAAKKGKSLDMWEAMEKMKHLSENRVKIATASAITFDGFADELAKIAIGRTRLHASNIVGIQRANPASWFQRARKFLTGTSRGTSVKARMAERTAGDAAAAARVRRAAAEAGPEAFERWKATQR